MGKVADVVVDFSNRDSLPEVTEYVRRTGTALVSGTTGFTAQQMEQLRRLGDCAPVLHSANYSIGVAVLKKLAAQAAAVLGEDFDIEIIETHHNQKADAPSGTAKLLLDAVDPNHTCTPVYGREGMCGKRTKNEIGVHALRGGTVAGEHTVAFFGPDEEVKLTHRADSRKIFAAGALKAAKKLVGKQNGYYTLEEILFSPFS
jgi:4-hydroxy-tetrahydrodipicolinate reductase